MKRERRRRGIFVAQTNESHLKLRGSDIVGGESETINADYATPLELKFFCNLFYNDATPTELAGTSGKLTS